MVIRIQPRTAWQAVATANPAQTAIQPKNAFLVATRRHKATTRVPCQYSLVPRSTTPRTGTTFTTAQHCRPQPGQQTGICQYRNSSSWGVPSPAARAAAATTSTSKPTPTAQEQSTKSKFVAPDPNTDYWKLYQDAVKSNPKGVDGVPSSLLFRVTLWLRAKAPPMTDEVATKLYELFLVHLRKRLFFQQDAIHELLAWYVPRNDLDRANKLLQPLIKEAQAGKKVRLESKAWMLVMLIKQGQESAAHQWIGPPETTWVPYWADFERWTRGSLSPAEQERARQVLRVYMEKRLEPNTKRFTHLLLSMFGKGKPADALALYQDTLDLGFPTSELVGSAVLNGLVNAGQVDEAMALWQRLQQTKAYHPTIATYNNLFSVLSRDPKRLAVTEDLWRYATAPDNNNNTHTRPDMYTFGHMMNAYFRARQVQSALAVWESMRKPPFEIEPNVVLYNTVLTGLFRARRPDLAKLEFEQMMVRQKALLLSSSSSSSSPRSKKGNKAKRGGRTAAVGLQGGGGGGQETIVPMDEEGQDTEASEGLVSTINIMLKGLISVKDLEGIQQVRAKMDEFRIEPNLETYTLISDVLFSQRLVESALKTVDLMASSGVEKSAISYSALIAGLVHTNQLERALEAFDDMKRAGFQPTVHVYGALIQGALRRGQSQLAEDMARQGKSLAPDGQLSTGAYSILIGHYTELNRRDRAMAWFVEMSRTTPRQRIPWKMYYVLLRGCVEHKDWDRAQQVLRVMDEHQFHAGVPRLAQLIAQVERESALRRAPAYGSAPLSSRR
ncbi:hypothetical protein BGZ73_002681 [Actinomortierella ambigua]|nr:hypothetical protein BGZ73_002681 [Actinomortierella ambigua]